MVNRDRMSQGDTGVMKFVVAVEDQARLCRANSVPIKETALARMKDST